MGVKMSVTCSSERRLIMFENRALRKIFGLERNKVKGEWRRRHKIIGLLKTH